MIFIASLSFITSCTSSGSPPDMTYASAMQERINANQARLERATIF